MSTILCLYVPGFQRQALKHVKTLSERSKRRKEQKKIKGSNFVVESAYNAQKAQFGLVMKLIRREAKTFHHRTKNKQL